LVVVSLYNQRSLAKSRASLMVRILFQRPLYPIPFFPPARSQTQFATFPEILNPQVGSAAGDLWLFSQLF
jgi:hypothetical protein